MSHCDGDDGDDDLGDLEGVAPTPKRQRLRSSRMIANKEHALGLANISL